MRLNGIFSYANELDNLQCLENSQKRYVEDKK